MLCLLLGKKHKAMKKIALLLLLAFAMFQCNVLEEDTLPNPDDDTEVANLVFVLKDGQGLINIPGLLSRTVTTDKVEFI